jgi:hypothetical protein
LAAIVCTRIVERGIVGLANFVMHGMFGAYVYAEVHNHGACSEDDIGVEVYVGSVQEISELILKNMNFIHYDGCPCHHGADALQSRDTKKSTRIERKSGGTLKGSL